MKWPVRVQEIVEALAAGIGHGAEDELRRATTRKIAEQCRFELGPNWGHKRADPGRPPSADVFCTKDPFVGWDWSVPEGIANFPESIDLTGQTFIEVEPVNHLGNEPNPEPEPEPEDPVDLTPLWLAINELKHRQEEFEKEVSSKFDFYEKWLLKLEVELARPLKAEGRTGNTAFHSHSVSLDVVKK